MYYQWGHKDPFTYPSNSENYVNGDAQNGKYPVKIYTIDGVLIYQDEKGGSNKDKQPAGGVIALTTAATSMMEAIKNPIISYGNWGFVISQVGHAKSLWDYYWTSYSRGSDGESYKNIAIWHNQYLDDYISQRSKSIYDPCPFGFRVPANGIWNDFVNLGWIVKSYVSGIVWSKDNITSWEGSIGIRNGSSAIFEWTGSYGCFHSSILSSKTTEYLNLMTSGKAVSPNHYQFTQSPGYSVRCIEEPDSPVRSDRRTRSVWKCGRFLYQ